MVRSYGWGWKSPVCSTAFGEADGARDGTGGIGSGEFDGDGDSAGALLDDGDSDGSAVVEGDGEGDGDEDSGGDTDVDGVRDVELVVEPSTETEKEGLYEVDAEMV